MSDSAPQPTTTTERPSWYRRMYQRVEALAGTPYALWAMLLVSVIDGSVFPIPPFAILVPMVLAQPKRWWRLALLGTIASFFGGLLGYYLGTLIHSGAASMFAVDLNRPVVVDRVLHIHSTVGQLLGDNFWFLALLCSVLPTPFKIVAIGSGIVSVPLSRFMLAAIIGRAVRFFLIAGAFGSMGTGAGKWFRR